VTAITSQVLETHIKELADAADVYKSAGKPIEYVVAVSSLVIAEGNLAIVQRLDTLIAQGEQG